MSRGTLSTIRLAAALLLSAGAAALAPAQSTAFTYQGRLDENGQPAGGAYDLVFALFDAPTGGASIAETCLNDRPVSDGLFVAEVNFGTIVRDTPLYLEIRSRRHVAGVDCATTSGFTTLTPRQKWTAAPLANYARLASGLAAPDGDPVAAVSVDNTGRVGVGTSTPSSQLELAGTQDALKLRAFEPFMTLTDTNLGNARVVIQNAGGRGFIINDDFLRGFNSGAFTLFDRNGRVGLGTYTPRNKLDVIGDISLGANGSHAKITSENGEISLWTTQYISNGFPALRIKNNGFISVGDFDSNFRMQLPNIGTPEGRILANAHITYSSCRWKHNVQPIDHALDKLLHLRGVMFDWNPEHGGTHDMGFVAEEVGQIIPEIVPWEPDGVFAQGLAYDRLTALAVEAIKEQQQQIDELRRTVEELQAAVKQLQKSK